MLIKNKPLPANRKNCLKRRRKTGKRSRKERENGGGGKEYTVAGLITEYRVQDGFRSGEKVALLPLKIILDPILSGSETGIICV